MRRPTLAMVLSCFLITGPAGAQDDTPNAHMKTAPNRTVVTGRLLTFQPAADGYGGDLVIEVVTNESRSFGGFLKPQAGSLRAFYPGPEQEEDLVACRKSVRVDLTFLGGPRGRAVVRSPGGLPRQ
jgi:hypothetical protein